MNNNYMLPPVFVSKGHKRLNKIVKIIVPSTIDVNIEIDNEKYVNDTLIFLSEIFQGATSEIAIGAWKAASGELVREDVNICYSYCDAQTLDNNFHKLLKYCESMREELRQECISLIVNNELHLI